MSTSPVALELFEQAGELVDLDSWLYDDPTFGFSSINPYSTRSDRAGGMFAPIFRTEMELGRIRGDARILEALSAMASGAILDNLQSYVFGEGFSYEVQPRKPRGRQPDERQQPVDLALAAVCTDIIEEFHEANEWLERQREIDRSARVDGDNFVAIFPAVRPNGICRVREVHAEYVSEPKDARLWDEHLGIGSPPSWTFGVHTLACDVERHLGYHVQWDEDGRDTQYFPACDGTVASIRRALMEKSGVVLQYKRNTPRNVKRGLSDFYPVSPGLLDDRKLVRNVQRGASLQAAIAWVEELPASTTKAKAEEVSKRESNRTAVIETPNGQRRRNSREVPAGTVLKVNGKTYKPGPMGAERNAGFSEAAQLGARRVGIRWNMPEYMISGDASNANYASTLVAESPFTKARETDQRYHRTREEKLLWTVLGCALLAGRFNEFGVRSMQDLKRRVSLIIEPPQISTSDKYQDAQVKEIEHRNGVLSVKTWAQETGRDPEVEQDNGAAPVASEVPTGLQPQQPAEASAVPQSTGTNDTLAAADSELRLNGAQITAAKDVIGDVAAGRIAASVGEQLLIAVGIDAAVAKSMIAETSANPPPAPAPATLTESAKPRSITRYWEGYP